jgi:hypothetical protein
MPRASKDADALWPFLLPKVQRALSTNASSSDGGTGSIGAPTPHGLSSVHHTGTLLSSQAPQFLLTDGSRALTGNLSVSSGITIDGVDLSAHVADPDAHHARAHVLATNVGLGTDHSMSGATAGHVLRASSATAAAFAQLQHADLGGVTANQHHNQIHLITGSDHTITGSAFQVVGATATNTLGLLTPSSDVGTTPAQAILKSTSSGGLILGTLTVKGSVDVINGGDLTVGSNILFVDASQASIGVNRSPDPQFDLDVAGNFRAAYIVGKHAIQLEDALIICHYDTKEPFGVNHYGELNGHRGQVAAPIGGIAVVPGKFYSSVSVGATATNLILNPRFENNVTDGWTEVSPGGGSFVRSTEETYIGQASGKLTYGASEAYIEDGTTNVTVGATISLSCWVYRKFGTGSVVLSVYNNTTAAIVATSAAAATYGEWEELVVSWTNGEAGARNVRFRLRVLAAETVFVSGCVKVAGTPVPYVDGDMGGYDINSKPNGDGYDWSVPASPHNSTSTRTIAARVSYPVTGNVNALRGTVMFWARVPWGDVPTLVAGGGGGSRFFTIGQSGTDTLYLRKVGSSGQLRVGIAGNDSAITHTPTWDRNWHHYAITYDSILNASNLYIDGTLVATGTAGQITPDTIWVGAGSNGTSQLDGYIDDFVITSRVQTAGRIRSIYESDAPVFAESSVFHFRATPRGLVWADDEGLWMRDINGDTVLGAYGGEATTKSWGGKNLEKGDIFFGRYGASDGGWLYFDRDGVSSKPFLSVGYAATEVMAFDSGGASLTGVLDISTSGGIYQGTGTFASPTTGLKVSNTGGLGVIAGYNTGTAQWYSDTNGRLYAGGGTVELSATGISVTADLGLPDDITGYGAENMISWRQAGTSVGGLGGAYDSGSGINRLTLGVHDAGPATAAQLLLIAGPLGTGAYVLLDDDGNVDIFAPNGMTLSSSLIGSPGVAITSDIALTGSFSVSAGLYLPKTSQTIASDTITYTSAYMVVDTEGAAATDNLATINGGADGAVLYLRQANSSRDVTLTETGNIRTDVGSTVALTSNQSFVQLIYDATLSLWLVMNRNT